MHTLSRDADAPLFPPGAAQEDRRAYRRRLKVFGAVFVALAVAGLAYVFSRPAEYRASARLMISPALATPVQAAAQGARPPRSDERQSFLNEVQVLTSRPLLDAAWPALQALAPRELGADPAAAAHAMVRAVALEGSSMVQLSAEGRHPAFLAALVGGLIEAYRARTEVSYRGESDTAAAQLREEAARVEAALAAKRAENEAFRKRYDIVSLEREENQVLARLKGMGTSLQAANDRVVAAEARLRALREPGAVGRGTGRARDNPVLAGLETQAASLRNELRELERQFTGDYLRIDPRARALVTRLEDLDRQIADQRAASQRAAIGEAEEELASARAVAERLQQQAAGDRHSVQTFVGRFNEYKALQAELQQMEALRRDVSERLVRQQATESARKPVLSVVEPATVPAEPFRPLYARDAGLVLGGSFVLALLAVWLVELFQRNPMPSTVILPQTWVPIPVGAGAAAARLPGSADPRLAGAADPLLPAPAPLPRELSAADVAQLWRDAPDDLRGGIGLLLSGVAEEEIAGLRAEHLRDDGQLRVGERTMPLPAPVFELLRARAQPDAPLVPAPAQSWRHALLCLAHDAGIEAPDRVDPEALRHTWIAHLVRQGVRFADLAVLAGGLDAATLARYAPLAPPGPKRPLQDIDLCLPGLAKSPGA